MRYQMNLIGTITEVNADGSWKVNVKSRGFDYPSVSSGDGKGDYQVGDSVNLEFQEGNKNVPYIMGTGVYR